MSAIVCILIQKLSLCLQRFAYLRKTLETLLKVWVQDGGTSTRARKIKILIIKSIKEPYSFERGAKPENKGSESVLAREKTSSAYVCSGLPTYAKVEHMSAAACILVQRLI